MKRSKLFITSIALAFTMVLAGGAIVTAQAAGKAIICVKKSSRQVYLAKNGKCKKGTTKTAITGATGPRGATGARGPQGPGTSQVIAVLSAGGKQSFAVGANVVFYGCNAGGVPWVAIRNSNTALPVRVNGVTNVTQRSGSETVAESAAVGSTAATVSVISANASSYYIGGAGAGLYLEAHISTIDANFKVNDIREISLSSQPVNNPGSLQCSFAGQITA
ncbi:hypothetical protein GCM10010401_20840 [Rarobacter faecitabidus]|uniref:Collagen triple helix repeat protein n=1 Tax=Rarobacter faecitabidus TaxID=13243 RepID=A0A542ZVG5_RARFA|nr:hypothetical protein [Rarobacter faecitabidus]TQL64289.1 hypothetical protein FB461_0787 [Rarobacter faecitabidus]